MSDPYTPPPSPGRELVATGADIAGSAAATAVGLLFAGPVGAIAGAALGPMVTEGIRRVTEEVAERVLGPRERARAGAAIAFAVQRLEQLAANGAKIRGDGFFDDLPSGRNAARETVEGVLLAARRSFEERKVRHLGYMIANIAVHPEVDPALAAHLLQRAEGLTWRQYVMLAAVGRAQELPLPPGTIDFQAKDWEGWGAKAEFLSLFEGYYFRAPDKTTEFADLPLINTEMSEQRLSAQGRLMLALLSLDEISDNDVLEVHRLLAVESDEAGAHA